MTNISGMILWFPDLYLVYTINGTPISENEEELWDVHGLNFGRLCSEKTNEHQVVFSCETWENAVYSMLFPTENIIVLSYAMGSHLLAFMWFDTKGNGFWRKNMFHHLFMTQTLFLMIDHD